MPTNPDAVAIIRDHVFYDPLQERDTASWQQLLELPAADELLNPAATTNDLPPFPVDRSFDSKAQYLEALYKILRFEAVEGLRFSINEFKSNPAMNDDQNTCVYTKVLVKGYLMAKLGPICRISFSTRRAGRTVLWKQAKRLTPGRIVALSSDNFDKDCRAAIVAQRPIEGGLDQNPPTVDIIWACAEEAVVDPDQELVMIESRNGFYEAARHAMIGLQLAAGEISNFDKYLIDLDDHDRLSRSIAANPLLNLSCLITQLTSAQKQQTSGNETLEKMLLQRIVARFQECDTSHPLSNLGIQPHTSLDSSQLEALQRMVSNELAIIQGPPGTGKTFTSVQALNTILANRRPGDPPVIVAAQTNHALDQLLIYCNSAGANIMRVGGRTENDVIKERTVYNLRQSLGKDAPGDGRAKYRSLEKARLQIIERFKTLVDGVFGGDGLLDPRALLDAGVINEAQFESLSSDGWEGNDEESPMQAWLGEEQIERLRQPPEDLDFMEEEAIDEPQFEVHPDLEEETAEDDDRLLGTWVPLTSHYTGNTPRVPGWQARCAASVSRSDDLYQIPVQLRGGVYKLLETKLREASTTKFRDILQQAVDHAKQQKVNKWFTDLNVIEKLCIDIIGCTTTGLTKYRGFLAATGARVLLIEEAAETREPNVTSALFPSLDQLILVGDHQQLPPQCDIARLGGEPFNLNVSLFERLVRNRLPYTMLKQQRRMAPELRYIVQKYYPNLKDHQLVKDDANRPPIPGMGSRRSWFFTHEWPEDTDADNSKFNPQEAEMIVSFMKYLVQNGVKPAEITVLTYYRGQRKRILQLLWKDFVPLGTRHFNVATVDSYQGEENEIVLLSLVRSPPTPFDAKRVGFVDSMNRATVAISRARRGFFMFGNKDNLFQASVQSFDTWAPVWNGFAEQQRVAMGKGLPLVCQNHNNEQSTNEIWMKSPESFVGNAGGCWIKCHASLPCGHRCVLNCHVIPHDKLPCLEPCIRILACGHKCTGVCTDPCRCCEDCDQFKIFQAERQLARLRLEVAPSPSSKVPASAPDPRRDSSPEKWVEFSQNPAAHDDAIRKAQLLSMAPLIELDTPPTYAGSPEKKAIKERFIPTSTRDGMRVVGKPASDLRSPRRAEVSARADTQSTIRHPHNGKQQRQGPQPQNCGHTPSKGQRFVTVPAFRNNGNSNSRANGQRGQAHQRPIPNRNKFSQRRQQQPATPSKGVIAAAENILQPPVKLLDTVLPVGGHAAADSISLMGESDLGFEAEVLGVRRGRYQTAQNMFNPKTLADLYPQAIGADVESLMSFGGDAAESPAKPAPASKNDKEDELLIEI